MRIRICVLLLLCLLLSGCGAAPELETIPISLPVPVEPVVPQEQDALPTLEARAVASSKVSGPSGSVYAMQYRNGSCLDPVYGDVDGDGLTELVYRSAGATNGTVYESLWVYGMEQGWPIQKGCCLLRIGNAKTSLVQDGGRVFYSYTDVAAGQSTAQLLPVSLSGNCVYVEGTLPGNLEYSEGWGSWYGVSFRELRTKVGDEVLAVDQGYFLWREPGTFYSEEELADDGLRSYACAALTENGVTVTGLVYWVREADGTESCTAKGVTPPVKVNESTLIGMAKQVLIAKLGEPCFTTELEHGESALCWFTESGSLMTLRLVNDAVAEVAFTDLPVR